MRLITLFHACYKNNVDNIKHDFTIGQYQTFQKTEL